MTLDQRILDIPLYNVYQVVTYIIKFSPENLLKFTGYDLSNDLSSLKYMVLLHVTGELYYLLIELLP